MLTSILNFILFVVFIYLILYGIYLLTINLKALFGAKEPLANSSSPIQNKICVIIFANSKAKGLGNLLHALNNQTYDKENYSVHVIFAKDSNSLLYTPDCISGAQIHCIENCEYFSKNKALNLFIEKLIPDSKFDGYVFLGPDRFIKQDFIAGVNNCLNKNGSGVYTGKTTVVSGFKNRCIKSKVIEIKQEFKNNTVNIARRMFGLAVVIDSENCVFTSDILEKTGRVCLETREDELKYSLFLASNGIKPVYYPFFETITEAENYNPATAGFSTRLLLFKYYLKILIGKPGYFAEFVLSLIKPNAAVMIILYCLLFWASFKFVSSIGIKYIFHLGIFYLLIWGIGLIAAKLSFKKVALFLLYPFYSFGFNFTKMTKDISRRALARTIIEERNVKSASMDAVVADGEKKVVCKMDLISEDGMRRVILRFRKKRVISDEFIRMHDAVENISKKVKSHGFDLKICQNCKNFEIIQDGTVDLLKGCCNRVPENSFDTLIWNSCNSFIPTESQNVIENLKK